MSFKQDLAKYKPRKEQREALEFIDTEYKSNPMNKFFLLNLPVGTGKSHLALMIADWYRKNVNRLSKIDIITNSKILQDQYADTYESISDLKGKENYECQQYSCSCAQGSEFNRLNKTSCEGCPYSGARESFISGGISLTNFYLYILYAIYNPKLLESRDSRVLIVDEAHEFDDVMSDFISIKITENVIKKFKFTNEYDIIKRLNSINTITNYVNFLGFLGNEISTTIESMESGLSGSRRNPVEDKRDLKISKLLKTKNTDVRLMQLITDLKQYQLKIEIFLKEYKENPNNWVLETNFNEKTKSRELSLEPIWAYDYLDKYVFSNYDMVFLMSGTILDKSLFCQLNGLDVSKAVYYSIPSPFNVKNRPIFYMPLGKMSYKNKEETFQRYIPYIQKILDKYSGKKGIIHTNSFELAKWIQNSIKDKRLIYHDSTNKDEILRMHKESEEPTVIVSPSMDTGVSFDNDDARFQIIAKVPYPSLASQKNKLRQKNNPDWYSWRTSCSLQQACGRIVRSNLDYGDTIILDGSFSDVIKYSSKFLPHWFQDSIKKINIKNSISG
jgi:ATP-dependent DNA helicase DinG